MLEQYIYNNFDGDYCQRGGEHYVAKTSAETFMQHVDALDIRILGIDGFVLSTAATQPVMEAIADYSQEGATPAEMMVFLNATAGKVTHFNFVLDN